MQYLYLVAILTTLVTFLLFRSPRLNSPEHVLQEIGDEVLILHTPLARLWPSQGKRISKQSAARIQKAGSIITVFNQSSNAIDINLLKRYSAQVFERACVLFPNTEKVVI
ncbi:hypothetical protein J8L84_11035 [Alteromonas sp. MMG017]|uniref:hypothetical protein n=1 Tax=Alteromonas sp. MMG017 TaxID=2822692 RepID=UPI001B39E880|nr:hypothetical protein [Alteromonas sp. MMG017]MBQ4829810.1 hypothetical protein [Alteromonas sp. MMG017]